MCQSIQQPIQGANTKTVAVLEFDVLQKKPAYSVKMVRKEHPVDQDILNHILDRQRKDAVAATDSTRHVTANTASLSQSLKIFARDVSVRPLRVRTE